MSSLHFLGNTTSYISIPNHVNLNFENQDFTVEWYQYQTDSNSYPRIFQKGSYLPDTLSIGLSIETGVVWYWRERVAYSVVTLAPSAYKNKWVHFAICRSSGITKVYKDGTSIFSLADTYDYTNTQDMVVSNETTRSNPASFGGYMYYFHYIKGVAKYTANFTVSTAMVTAIPETVLLLTADGASGSLGNTITNTAGTFAITPGPAPAPAPAPAFPVTKQSLFTDNSRVYYKKSSLAPGGIGGVRNYRIKSHKT